MKRELSLGTVIAVLAVVLLLILGAWFAYEGRRKQQSQEIEKIIQRGIGAPPTPSAPRKP